MRRPVLVTPPTTQPVTLDAVKETLRVDHDDQDDMIAGLIAASIGLLDGWAGILGQCLEEQTWRQDYCAFSPSPRLRLPLGPVTGIESVKYYAPGGEAPETLDSGLYELAADSRGWFVALKPDAVWPAAARREDAVQVTFMAGHEASGGASTVPAPIKTAIHMIVRDLFDGRPADTPDNLPADVRALLAPFRRVGV